MQISRISQFTNAQPRFNGLWGERKFVNTESLYGGEYVCDYYEQTYYPCLDETREEIAQAIDKKDKEVNKPLGMDDISGEYCTFKTGKRLAMTTDVIDAIQEGRMHEDIPFFKRIKRH